LEGIITKNIKVYYFSQPICDNSSIEKFYKIKNRLAEKRISARKFENRKLAVP
jgi:hypothetical protein